MRKQVLRWPPVGGGSRAWQVHRRRPYRSLHDFGVAEDNADVDRRDRYGRTPLMVAAVQGNVPLLRRLLARGASAKLVDGCGFTPLYYVANRWHGPLQMTVARMLVRHGVDVDAESRDGMRQTALLYAIVNKEHRLIRYLLDKGRRSSRKKARTLALWDALHHGNSPRTIDILLDYDLDVNEPGILHELIGWGRPDYIRKIIRKGVDVNRRNAGVTPLISAVRYGTQCAVQILLEAGANPDIRDDDGRTALDYATNDDHWDADERRRLIDLLISHGAERSDE